MEGRTLLSHDGKRWLIGATRADLWFDKHRTIAFFGSINAIVVLIIPTAAVGSFISAALSGKELTTFFTLLTFLVCAPLMAGYAVLRYLDYRSLKYYISRDHRFNGPLRREVSDTFELLSIFSITVQLNRLRIWDVRKEIDILAQRRENTFDRGLSLDHREYELSYREDILKRVPSILVKLSVDKWYANQWINEFRMEAQAIDARNAQKIQDGCKKMIAEKESEIVDQRSTINSMKVIKDLVSNGK